MASKADDYIKRYNETGDEVWKQLALAALEQERAQKVFSSSPPTLQPIPEHAPPDLGERIMTPLAPLANAIEDFRRTRFSMEPKDPAKKGKVKGLQKLLQGPSEMEGTAYQSLVAFLEALGKKKKSEKEKIEIKDANEK